MEVILQLSTELARQVAGAAAGTGDDSLHRMKDIEKTAVHLGFSLSPIHPGTTDEELARYFTLSGQSPLDTDQLLSTLQNLEGVTAAYTKPGAEPA